MASAMKKNKGGRGDQKHWEWEKGRFTILDRVGRKGPTNDMTSQNRSDGNEEVSLVDMWQKDIPDRGKMSSKT